MSSSAIRLPDTTRQRLTDFQRRVRVIKIAEGLLAAIFGLAVSYLAVFVIDRFVDTSTAVRAALLLGGCLGMALFFPLKCHRWVWGTRRMEQVATLVKQKYPALGDQLLGVVELARGDASLGTSETLARAAVAHVDQMVRDRNLSDAVPHPGHRKWAIAAVVPALLMLAVLVVVPAAGSNALQRWLMPWRDVDRFTFARVDDLPDHIVIPHGEDVDFSARLSEDTQWSPASGTVRMEQQQPVASGLSGGVYRFHLPPQTESGKLNVRIGDIRESLSVQVANRPELESLTATIELPDYLQYSMPLTTDVRGGVVSVVKGAVVSFAADISRELKVASVEGIDVAVTGNRMQPDPVAVEEDQTLSLQWTDNLGLSGKDPFRLKIRAVDDTEPGITFQQLDSEQVVLSTDVVTFDVQADDDFGLQEIGLEWHGIENPLRNPNPQDGDKVIARGAPEQSSFSGQATFCAVHDNVKPQSMEVRAYATDFKPERGRVYSPTYVIHVLTPEEHAIWVTNQLRRWASLADDVYEEEMRLHAANRDLRQMNADELNDAATRRQIEQQSAAERANGQRLGTVVDQGEQLIKQALRNKEMLVGHLETWADSLEALKGIAENRMPNVADMLAKAAKAPGKPGKTKPSSSESQPADSSDMVGNNRSDAAGKSGESSDSKKLPPSETPALTDVESGFANSEEAKTDPQQQSAGKSRLTLPTTVLQGGPPPKGDSCPVQQEVEQAVEEQENLLAEFAKVREDLQKIMDDLENSTFVKRLKAASRRQMEIADDLNRTLYSGFGVPADSLQSKQQDLVGRIAEREDAQSRSVWMIQSDLSAYYDRRKSPTFLRILDEMEEVKVTTSLTAVGERVRQNLSGESIARAEFWCDTLDRWAEELVEPSPGGS